MEEACDDTAPVCVDRACVCQADVDCKAPNLARCNTTTGECAPCESDDHCTGIRDLPNDNNICLDDGTCVDCTPDTETTACEDNVSCNPSTNECTDTEIGSLLECDECVADSECGDGFGASSAFRCIQLEYQGELFPTEGRGYCLKSVAEGGSCENPYRIVIPRPSLSGEPVDDYCGINEELTTCPAIQALIADTPCDPENGDSDCPQPAGLCQELPGAVTRCTYRCESLVECITPGATCNTSLPEDVRYCGS
jgi:hypothetical protein